MKSMSMWLGRQIKSYVNATIPSWSNLPNNPEGRGSSAAMGEKPPRHTNFIYVGEGCTVQEEDEADPFRVLPKYDLS